MSRRISILIIDDDKAMRTILKDELPLFGFEVYLAKNGKAGIKLARKLAKRGTLGVILLDWMMPGLDGIHVLSELKYNEVTENIPVFMLTEKSNIDEIDRAYEIGADDYIVKVFKRPQIGSIIKRKLEKLAKIKGKKTTVSNIS